MTKESRLHIYDSLNTGAGKNDKVIQYIAGIKKSVLAEKQTEI